MNRGDWSSGYDYAEDGLSDFVVETEEDKEIYEELSEILSDDDDIDGRVFRDCKWSYNTLYSMSDQAAYKDLQELLKYYDPY